VVHLPCDACELLIDHARPGLGLLLDKSFHVKQSHGPDSTHHPEELELAEVGHDLLRDQLVPPKRVNVARAVVAIDITHMNGLDESDLLDLGELVILGEVGHREWDVGD